MKVLEFPSAKSEGHPIRGDHSAGTNLSGKFIRLDDVETARHEREPVAPIWRRSDMDDMAREWVNARLEATEERMNARLAGIESSIQLAVGKLDALGNQIADAKNEAIRAHDEAVKARDAALNNKWFFVGTAIALAAVIAAMLAFGVQNFDSALAAISELQSLRSGGQ